MSIRDEAIQILQKAGRPLRTKELTKRMIEARCCSSTSKTPEATVNRCLNSDIKKHGDQSAFVKVALGLFFLRDIQCFAICDVEGPELKNEGYSFMDAAEKVLDQFGNRNPMHYCDITDKALSQGWLNTSGDTPNATMNSGLAMEIKRAKSSGNLGRFVRTSAGYYSLTKWMGADLPYQISNHNLEVRKKLLSQLRALDPEQFEELVSQLLMEMGFENIEVTQYRNDGGIDVRGTLLIGDVVRIQMAVQAKRWKGNIHSATVREVRGSLGIHEQGLIIATSNFSLGAVKEANQLDKTPVGLMNGEQLVKLLMEYNIGVRRMSHDLFEMVDLK